MTKIPLIRTFALVGSLALLGTVSYGEDKPIKKDLKITSTPKNINNALISYLRKALGQKINVVTLDSDVAPEGRNVFINQASAEGIGQSLVQTLAKQMGNSGDFAILSATPNTRRVLPKRRARCRLTRT